MQSSTIKVYLIKGNPESLRTAEISNWTGKAISAPRTELKEFLKRKELHRPGVYILAGTDPESNNPVIYIGEADSVADRIKGHAGKDYWVNAIVFASKDDNLTKAHIKYLEGKLIEKATEAGRVQLMNSMSSGASLSESDIAEMDVFLSNMYLLLPVLGVNYFRTSEERMAEEKEIFYCKIKGLTATGKRSLSGFVVFKGSEAVLDHRPSAKTIRNIRERLIISGVLIREGNHLSFTKDMEFGSPSTASGVVRGGNTNGLIQWRNAEGKSLKELEKEQVL
ncbi:hypothetical protein ES707_16949 [subsurface metagenome]